MMTLDEAVKKVRPLDEKAMEGARKRWDSIAKPLHSLGELENMLTQIAGITGTPEVRVEKKAVVAMCADNGVVEEGVTQTGQEVTAIVAENFLKGDTSACVMCRQCGTDVFPVDVGMASDTKVPSDLKVMMGTRNMTKEPAMTYEEAVQGIEAGIEMVRRLKEQGYRLIATGEMGIGNTTTSAAMAAALLSVPPEIVAGRGAGLSDEGLARKRQVIAEALEKYQLRETEPMRILCSVGGLDIAGLCGVFLGGAKYHMPIVADGVISAVAALTAERLCPGTKEFIIPSHKGKEPASELLMRELGLSPVLDAGLALGEGTGAVMMFSLLDIAMSLYETGATFGDFKIEEYHRF